MQVAHFAFIALVGLSPLLLFFDGLFVDGVIELYTAIVLILIAFSVRPGEAGHWMKTIRWAIALATLPLLWLGIQLLPLPIGGVSGSIWQSAGSALGKPMSPSMTIDTGLTILAFCRYGSLVAVATIAAAVSIERQRAERLLFALGFATVAIAVIAAVLQLAGFGFDAPSANTMPAAVAAASVYGVVLFAVITILIVERHLTRRGSQDFRSQFLAPLAGAIAGLAICGLATIIAGSEQTVFAAASGLATVAIIQFVRRIGLDWRAATLMAGIAVFGAAVIVSTKANPALADFSMRYAARATADLISVADRMAGEVGIGGSGGGTFGALYRLYAPQDIANTAVAPTSAAQIAIELGRPALWIIVVTVLVLVLLCARGGFGRGRDYFYSMAGAGVGMATLVLAFCDIGLDNMAVSILLASAMGLALAQRLSRTI